MTEMLHARRNVGMMRVAAFGCVLLLGACAMQGAGGGGSGDVVDHGATRMVVSANPLASEAGLDILRAGGSAVDAAIAVQAVLGLLEPQASGLMGGSVTLIYDPATSSIESFDGMATAPLAATVSLNVGRTGTLFDPRTTAFTPRAVGIPGVLPALWQAQRAHGKLPWARLFQRAERLASEGAPMPKQLHDLLVEPGADTALAAIRKPYLAADGTVIPTGELFRNPAYAAVLRRVAQLGPEGIWAEGGMRATLAALAQAPRASWITEPELRAASPRVGPALCAPWQGMQICTAPAPAIGGIVMLQILGTTPSGDPDDPAFAHRFLEASRLAEADRRRYLADPAFVEVPVAGLLDPAYLAQRAALIQPTTTISRPRAGEFSDAGLREGDPGDPQAGTSSVAVVDGNGQAVAMTSTINLHFGARLSAEGMVLNNAMINFAPPPPTSLKQLGGRYANEMAPGKRPVSPIAPVIVLDAGGKPVLIGGGAGGAPIPDVMARVLNDLMIRHRPLPDTLAAGHFHAADPDHIVLETGTPAASLRAPLDAVGHRVELEQVDTGTAILLRQEDGWRGLSDPRRDGGAGQGTK
jgi:gamma-glutamyltranspeptidase/glutathione hydrolase